MFGERSTPTVEPVPFARTSLRNISPDPVATSSTFIPSRRPEISIAQRWAREWKNMVERGYTAASLS
jgi:hypothetical protein